MLFGEDFLTVLNTFSSLIFSRRASVIYFAPPFHEGRKRGRNLPIRTLLRPCQTESNAPRKTRPKGRVLRVHTFDSMKTDRISREHMQRNNAKDDAVEGGENGERPPSSQPIAPAVAGKAPPQPAGKSIPKSPCRDAGIFRNLGLAAMVI